MKNTFSIFLSDLKKLVRSPLALAIAISVWAYINKNIKHHPHEPDAHAGGQIEASNQKPSDAEQGESNEQAD